PVLHRVFFNHSPPPEFSTLSLYDALPIFRASRCLAALNAGPSTCSSVALAYAAYVRVLRRTAGSAAINWPSEVSGATARKRSSRSEEHTSELQSHLNLVCRRLLEKKKQQE